MARRPEEIEQAFRSEQWRALAFDAKRSWYLWAGLAVLLATFAWYYASPQHVVGIVQGEAVGMTLPATEDNSAPMMMAVRLETNTIVNVPLPRGQMYRAGAHVELQLLRRDWAPHSTLYRFVRYSE